MRLKRRARELTKNSLPENSCIRDLFEKVGILSRAGNAKGSGSLANCDNENIIRDTKLLASTNGIPLPRCTDDLSAGHVDIVCERFIILYIRVRGADRLDDGAELNGADGRGREQGGEEEEIPGGDNGD